MKSKLIQITSLVVALCFLYSCNKPLFRPEQVHDPMITQKDEVNVNASAMLMSIYGSPTIELGFGYSPINHFTIKGAGRLLSVKSSETDHNSNIILGEEYHINKKSFDGGLGYYTNIDQNLYLSVFGGAIMGKTNYEPVVIDGNVISESMKFNYRSFYLQPSIIYIAKKCRLGIGYRLGMYNFRIKKIEGMSYEDAMNYISQSDMEKIIGEPYVNFEIGKRNLRFNLQGGYSMVSRSLMNNDGSPNFNFSVGFNVRLLPEKNN